MHYEEIYNFLPESGVAAMRTAFVMSVLSPSSRQAALVHGGLTFGGIEIGFDDDGLTIDVLAATPIPPIDWWDFSGTVTIRSNCASTTACNLINVLKCSWEKAHISHVEFKHEDEPEEDVQKSIIQALYAVRDDVIELCLGTFYLHESDELPNFRRLRNLFLTDFSGSLEKWEGVLSSTAERVEICDSSCFTSQSPATLRCSNWYRLILDSTDVTSTFVEQLLGVESIQTLSLTDCRSVDSLDVGRFCNLRQLLLGRSSISSELLTGVELCSRLRLVNLGGCRAITDVNVLGDLKELRELFVHETSVSNAGIVRLNECVNLEKLNLGGCRFISNVNCLGSLSGLKELHLWSTKISNSGIEGLCTCHSLTELVLDDCYRITDVSVLRHLQSLRWLSLIGTDVNGSGVKDLIFCNSLETLALAGTRLQKPPKLWRHEAIIEYLSSFR